MKDGLVVFLGLVMVAYVLFTALVTFVFLPLAGGFFYGHIGAYYLSLILIATLAVAFSFFEKRGAAGLLAVILLLTVLFYWWRNGYTGPWDWSIFFWNTFPAFVFAGCAIANWVIRRSAPNEPEVSDSAD